MHACACNQNHLQCSRCRQLPLWWGAGALMLQCVLLGSAGMCIRWDFSWLEASLLIMHILLTAGTTRHECKSMLLNARISVTGTIELQKSNLDPQSVFSVALYHHQHEDEILRGKQARSKDG